VNGRVTEHHYQTPEQVRAYLREALAVVAELVPPEDLRVACFTKAADLVSAKHVMVEAIQPGIPNLTIPRKKP